MHFEAPTTSENAGEHSWNKLRQFYFWVKKNFWNQILIPRNFELKIHFHSKVRLTHTSYSHKKFSVCQKRNLKPRIYSSRWVEQLRMLQCEIWTSSHGAIVINVKIFKTPHPDSLFEISAFIWSTPVDQYGLKGLQKGKNVENPLFLPLGPRRGRYGAKRLQS